VRSHTETRHDPGKEGGYEFGYHLGFDGKYETGLHYVPGYPPHDYEVEVCDERAPSRYETLRASR
jgi:hypothetical protein